MMRGVDVASALVLLLSALGLAGRAPSLLLVRRQQLPETSIQGVVPLLQLVQEGADLVKRGVQILVLLVSLEQRVLARVLARDGTRLPVGPGHCCS